MSETAGRVYAYLDALGVAYQKVGHEAVFTIQECAPIDELLHAVVAKNYFLATKHRDRFYLCLVRPDVRFKSVDISRQIGSTRLSFGPEDALERLLQTHPGAVSPMGLIFDTEKQVQLLVDSGLAQVPRIAFHPCDNTQTLAMGAQDFFDVFLPAVGHAPRFVEIHDFM